MLNTCGVKIDTNDSATWIDPGGIGKDGAWKVERCENAVAQQKGVPDASGVIVESYHVTFGVICSNKR